MNAWRPVACRAFRQVGCLETTELVLQTPAAPPGLNSDEIRGSSHRICPCGARDPDIGVGVEVQCFLSLRDSRAFLLLPIKSMVMTAHLSY